MKTGPGWLKHGRVRARCECADSGCPGHTGRPVCVNGTMGGSTLYRVDMEDRTGTRFCSDCADDAIDSGLFR